jgi:hypothetical protein
MGGISGYLAVKEKFDIQREKQKREAKEKYLQSPNICKHCSSVIPYEKRKSSLLFCGHSCSAAYNNVRRQKKLKIVSDSSSIVEKQKKDIVEKQKKEYYCLSCKKVLSNKAVKYCNSLCQRDLRKKNLYDRLDRGMVDGVDTRRVREYLIDKHGAKCMAVDEKGNKCGWDKVNPFSGRCPIELEHKDGNSQNNNLENLILLCPSCHSLTPTYKNLNRGNGRHKRRIRYNEGKSY